MFDKARALVQQHKHTRLGFKDFMKKQREYETLARGDGTKDSI